MVVDWEGTGNYVHCARCGRYFDTSLEFDEHRLDCLRKAQHLTHREFRKARFAQHVDRFKRRLVRVRPINFRDVDAPTVSSSQADRINSGLRAKRIRSVEWSLDDVKNNNKRHRWWQRRKQ